MTEVLIFILSTAGAVFVLLAAIGLLRMPDLYLRISVTTKAATLGIGLILAGAALYFDDVAVTTRVLAIVLFILLTAPVGAHLLGRASYFIGLRMWKNSVIDDLEDKYHKRSHKLSSEEDAEAKKEDGGE